MHLIKFFICELNFRQLEISALRDRPVWKSSLQSHSIVRRRVYINLLRDAKATFDLLTSCDFKGSCLTEYYLKICIFFNILYLLGTVIKRRLPKFVSMTCLLKKNHFGFIYINYELIFCTVFVSTWKREYFSLLCMFQL